MVADGRNALGIRNPEGGGEEEGYCEAQCKSLTHVVVSACVYYRNS